MSFKRFSAVAVALTCGFAVSAVEAAPRTGFLILADGGEERIEHLSSNLDQDSIQNGCLIVREGPVVGENGDLDIDQPDYFIYLSCPEISKNTESVVFTRHLKEGDKLLQGPIIDSDGGKPEESGVQREYILKVSNFNNKNPKTRNEDLTAIQSALPPRPVRYVTEAYIRVFDAVGMPRPDEAVVLYYDTPGHGDRFRSEYKDVLTAIGGFNQRHLDGFVYYSARSKR